MRSNHVQSILCVVACSWVVLVPPGLSYYWLIDSEIHAQIDAVRYGQTPDGRTLPGCAERPAHDHPAGAAVSVSAISLASIFQIASYYDADTPAKRSSLGGKRVDDAVIGESIALPPLEHPPRV